MTTLPDQPRLLTADAIAPMDPALPPVLLNSGIVITGQRITAVGERSDLRRIYGDLPAEGEHLPGLLLPGFVNAHTHLELSYLSTELLGLDPPPPFPHWVSALMAKRPPPDQLESITRSAFTKGLQLSLAAGVTTIGDISRNAAITRNQYLRLAQSAPLPRLVSYGEVVALGKMRHRVTEFLDAATQYPAGDQGPQATDHNSPLFLGISPHAPYTVEGPALRVSVRRALVKNLPICMHLAELAEESRFLRNLSGPLGRQWDLMQKMDILDDQIPLYSGGPIRWAQLHGLLVTGPRELAVLLAHVNYCDHAELNQLAATTASVAYCPRTRQYFGHDLVTPHRYRDMLAAGINVCLGTDSLASNPDLNPLQEARLIHQRDQLPAHAALEMITRRPAHALGLGDLTGSIAPNKFADLLYFPMSWSPTEDPLTQLLQQAPAPQGIWIAGRRVNFAELAKL